MKTSQIPCPECKAVEEDGLLPYCEIPIQAFADLDSEQPWPHKITKEDIWDIKEVLNKETMHVARVLSVECLNCGKKYTADNAFEALKPLFNRPPPKNGD